MRFLDSKSETAWRMKVPSIFKVADSITGKGELQEGLELVISSLTRGARTVSCPKGSVVYFPNNRSPHSKDKKNDRSAKYCIIYLDDLNLTLRLGVGVEVQTREILGPLPV